MIPFQFVEFYDVPRCIVLRYRQKVLLLQSAFDEQLDEYPNTYSVYVTPEWVEDEVRAHSWAFLENTPMSCIGHIQIESVKFDPTRRKELDVTCLDGLKLP